MEVPRVIELAYMRSLDASHLFEAQHLMELLTPHFFQNAR